MLLRYLEKFASRLKAENLTKQCACDRWCSLLFNFSFQHSLAEMKELTDSEVTLLGNIPTRDVLATGSPDDVRNSVQSALDSVEDKRRIILSCGGGMPPDVPTENIEAFLSR